jgi:hypothetical protein
MPYTSSNRWMPSAVPSGDFDPASALTGDGMLAAFDASVDSLLAFYMMVDTLRERVELLEAKINRLLGELPDQE